MTKWMWIIAGPNGAGKSTFTQTFFSEPEFDDLILLNADERTARLRVRNSSAAQSDLNKQAADEIDAEVATNIEAGRSFLVETVLSSSKYRDDVEAAKASGFKIGLIYVSLHPPELSPLRVSERVMQGGHSVDPARALARYPRSHRQLTWFARRADFLLVYDNSSEDADPERIASRFVSDEPVTIHAPGRNPAVDRALASLTARRAPKKRNRRR